MVWLYSVQWYSDEYTVDTFRNGAPYVICISVDCWPTCCLQRHQQPIVGSCIAFWCFLRLQHQLPSWSFSDTWVHPEVIAGQFYSHLQSCLYFSKYTFYLTWKFRILPNLNNNFRLSLRALNKWTLFSSTFPFWLHKIVLSHFLCPGRTLSCPYDILEANSSSMLMATKQTLTLCPLMIQYIC